MLYTNPLFGIIKTFILFITGRVQFDKSIVGNRIIMKDDKAFTVFRRVVIKHFGSQDKRPEALFIIRFTPTMDLQSNIKLSRIVLFVFMGFKGFRSKYWCVNEESGECQGIYEWDTKADAERYSQSIAIRNMTKRSVPGSISFEILENTSKAHSWEIEETEAETKRRFRQAFGFSQA